MGIAGTSFMQAGNGLQRHDLTIIDPDADGDSLYPTFVRPDAAADQGSDTAVLYWIESAGTQLRTRFGVFRGVGTWAYPSDLSIQSWQVNGSFDVGDYRRGVFYQDGSFWFGPC
jgi:hypothetical protein